MSENEHLGHKVVGEPVLRKGPVLGKTVSDPVRREAPVVISAKPKKSTTSTDGQLSDAEVRKIFEDAAKQAVQKSNDTVLNKEQLEVVKTNIKRERDKKKKGGS